MTNTYWNEKGKYQQVIEALQARVPEEGEVADKKKNPALEKFRKASNCYYDLYNNGLCNRAREFRHAFGFASQGDRYRTRYGWEWMPAFYERVEQKMDEIVMEAAAEQQLVTLHLETAGVL